MIDISMAKELKKIIVNEYLTEYKDKKNFIFVSCKGINALESINVREKLRNSGIMFRVVKNSLILIVFKEIGLTELSKYIEGFCAVATSKGDCVELAKVLVDCSKKVENLKINGGYLDGQQMQPDGIVELSKLPNRSVVNAQILSGIRSPMVGLANAFNSILRSLLTCLKEISDKKQ